jgi:hypothetical protein
LRACYARSCMHRFDVTDHVMIGVKVKLHLLEQCKLALQNANAVFTSHPRLCQVEIEFSVCLLVRGRGLVSWGNCLAELICGIGQKVLA